MANTAGMSTKGQLFWNAYGNIQAGIESAEGYDYNRELLTYIQADDRYISYIDEYLETATDLTEPKEDIRARAVAEHETAVNVLEISDGYSTAVQGVANDFYFVIEQEYPNANAAPVVADQEAAPVESVETAPVVAVQEAEPVFTPMGDFAMMQTPMLDMPSIEETPVVPETITIASVEPVYDESFARAQLGDLADAPEEEFTPVTESITPEAMPVPILEEIAPESDIAADTTASIPEEDTSTITNFSDAGILLNGEASDDMAYLANLAEEAREMGVDAALIDSIESQIAVTGDQTKFVTTAAATEAVSVYADALDRALADGVVGRDEYKQALSGLFTSIAAGGIVVDRAGMADDIAAAPGMKEQAQDSLRRVFDASAANREQRLDVPQPTVMLDTQRGMALTNG